MEDQKKVAQTNTEPYDEPKAKVVKLDSVRTNKPSWSGGPGGNTSAPGQMKKKG